MIPKGSKIKEYLESIGYEMESDSEIKNGDLIVSFIKTYIKADDKSIKIVFNEMWGNEFKIYRNDMKVFDIDEEVREVLPLKHGSDKKIKSRGIPGAITLEEVKAALRRYNIDTLLDGDLG